MGNEKIRIIVLTNAFIQMGKEGESRDKKQEKVLVWVKHGFGAEEGMDTFAAPVDNMHLSLHRGQGRQEEERKRKKIYTHHLDFRYGANTDYIHCHADFNRWSCDMA